MSRYEERDFMITFDGDIIIEDNDIKIAENSGNVMQEVFCKLKSMNEEWITGNLCANLERMLGKANTIENGEMMEKMITDALINDGLLDADDIYVKAVPINKSNVSLFVYFKSPVDIEPYGFEVSLNLSSGSTVRRIK